MWRILYLMRVFVGIKTAEMKVLPKEKEKKNSAKDCCTTTFLVWKGPLLVEFQ